MGEWKIRNNISERRGGKDHACLLSCAFIVCHDVMKIEPLERNNSHLSVQTPHPLPTIQLSEGMLLPAHQYL